MKNVAQNKYRNIEGTRRVPALRFSEFAEGSAGVSKAGSSRVRDAAAVGLEWEEKKIEDIAKVNPGGGLIPERFVYIDLESVEKGVLKSEKTVEKQSAPSRAQRKLKRRDVIFQMVRPYQQNNYLFDKEGDYVASTGYAQLRVYGDALFLYHYLHTTPFANKVLARCTGSSYPAIKSDDLKKIRINAPGANEQKKIAGFLGAVDEWIGVLREEKSTLETYKRGVMQKLFAQAVRFRPANGNDFPDWEEKRFRDVAVFFSGGTPLTTESDYYNGNIPFIKSGEIESDHTAQYLSENGLKNSSAKRVKEGDLLYALYGATSGQVALSKIGGAINQAVLCIRSQGSVPYFLSTILNKEKGRILSKYLQGGQGNLSANIIKSLKVSLPEIEEQKKIADFLTGLDEIIITKTDEITKAEEWKKGLMQKMFV